MREAVVVLLLLRLDVLEKELVAVVEEPKELGGIDEAGWSDPEIVGIDISTVRPLLLGASLAKIADDHYNASLVEVIIIACHDL